MTRNAAMHDIKWIRDNPDAFDAALKRRGLEPMSAKLIAIDEKRREAILASERAGAAQFRIKGNRRRQEDKG